MNLRTVKGIYLVVLVLGIAVIIAGRFLFGSSAAVIWTGAGLLIAGIVFHSIFFRCPHCRRYLFRNNTDTCQFCGKPIFEDEAGSQDAEN